MKFKIAQNDSKSPTSFPSLRATLGEARDEIIAFRKEHYAILQKSDVRSLRLETVLVIRKYVRTPVDTYWLNAIRRPSAPPFMSPSAFRTGAESKVRFEPTFTRGVHYPPVVFTQRHHFAHIWTVLILQGFWSQPVQRRDKQAKTNLAINYE